MLGAVGGRLRGLGYAISDVLYLLARVPKAIAGGVAGFWRSLPVITRRRLVAATGFVAVVLLIALVAVPNLPCSLPGGDECAPEDDALDLAPAGAIAYFHTNLDPETEQAELATEVAARMPQVTRQVIGQAVRILDVGAPIAAATEGWFGGEAAVVVLGDGEQVQLLETDDAGRARRYAESIASGVPATGDYRDVEISEDDRGVASAIVGSFLALGTAQGVRAVIDVETGAEGADSLADDDVAAEALDALPDHRFVEAFLSADGIEEFVADRESPLSTLEPLVDSAASRGAAAALSADGDGFELSVRSVLDPERGGANPGFFEAFDEFEPELPDELPADSLAYLGLGRPSETVEALLRQATVGAPGIAAGFTDLIEELRGVAEVDVEQDLLGALGGEGAFAVVPRAEAEPGSELLPADGAETPYLEFLADEVDEDRAREALARLQEPIAQSFDPELGVPTFQQREIGDVEAQVLRLSPVAQIVYAIADSKLLIANDLAALERLGDDEDGLASADRYEETVDDLPDEPALLAYLDLRGLLAFAERTGLAEDPAYTTFAPDLRRLGSLGLAVTRGDDQLAVDARLLVD
jgi:Protein of unknown function (DUF3352)